MTYFDTLVVCGFAFEAQVGQETQKLGKLTVLKARMSQELHTSPLCEGGDMSGGGAAGVEKMAQGWARAAALPVAAALTIGWDWRAREDSNL